MIGGATNQPFRHWVIDGAVPWLCTDHFPGPGWPGWEARYGSDHEAHKRTARRDLTPKVLDVLDGLRSAVAVEEWCRAVGYAVIPDPTLHGGGLQVTAPGGVLGVHLDYDRHPHMPAWRRALTVIAYLHPTWKYEWGGGLLLCDPTGRTVRRIDPLPGRVVAFEASDIAYHGVEPVTGPADRVSLMLTYLAPATAASVRTCALFLPNRRPSPCERS